MADRLDQGRSRWRGRHADQLPLVAACRDLLQVIRGQSGIDYSGGLEPVILEATDLSVGLGEVWTDGLQAYRKMGFDHRTVVHKQRYVSTEGVHINQAECLFSLVKPWLRKFRGLSNQGWNRPLTPSASMARSTSPANPSRPPSTASLSRLSAALNKSVERNSIAV